MKVDSYWKMKYVRHNFTPVKNKLLNKHSDAESHFKQLLIDANIYFSREKGNYRYNTRWCYYDFYIPYFRICVEIDGESHNTEKQKAIDDEKTRLMRSRQKFVARFTNEEVLEMESITMDDIIDRVALNLKTKRHPHRNYREKYFHTLEENINKSIEDMKESAKYEIEEDKPVFLYDNTIGNYIEFPNILVAKLNTELSINVIFDLLYDFPYKRSLNRRYVFGWTLEECENNVAKVFY